MGAQTEKIPGRFQLTKELWCVITLKILVIIALWHFFFAHPPSEQIKTDAAVAVHVYGLPKSHDH